MNFKANQITCLLAKINFRCSGLTSTRLVATYNSHAPSLGPTLKPIIQRHNRRFSLLSTLYQKGEKSLESFQRPDTSGRGRIDPQAREKAKIIYFVGFIVCLFLGMVYMMFKMNQSFDIVYVGNENKK